jgi:hypothetical protein
MSSVNSSSDEEPKPVLWVGLTETGRTIAGEDHLEKVGDRVQEAVGDDYHVVAADDTVRLPNQEAIEDLRSEVARLRHQLPDPNNDG